MTTLTFRSPAPFQTFTVTGATVTSDANCLCTVPLGSDLAKALINYGWTVVTALPTADPKIDGVLWNDEGTLTISAG